MTKEEIFCRSLIREHLYFSTEQNEYEEGAQFAFRTAAKVYCQLFNLPYESIYNDVKQELEYEERMRAV